jgi:hypothetical protein
MTKDASYRIGDNVKIIVSNKPYVDLNIPPESNDYRWAEYAYIKIIDPCARIIKEDSLCPFTERIGWYFYNFQLEDGMKEGIWKIEITLTSNVPKCGINPCDIPLTPGTTGTSGTGTSGTSGVGTSGTSGIGTSGTSGSPSPYYDLLTNKAINYFRVLNMDVM